MQIDEPAPPSEVSSYPVPQPEDPYIADLLQVADNRCVTYSFAELEGVDVCMSQGPEFNHCHHHLHLCFCPVSQPPNNDGDFLLIMKACL